MISFKGFSVSVIVKPIAFILSSVGVPHYTKTFSFPFADLSHIHRLFHLHNPKPFHFLHLLDPTQIRLHHHIPVQTDLSLLIIHLTWHR
jgi:hypothetical protein